MRAVARKEEPEDLGNLEYMTGILLRTLLSADAGSFEGLLFKMAVWERYLLPADVREMIEVHIQAYGRSSSEFSRGEFRLRYRGRILSELLPGRARLPDLGKKERFVMFFGGMLILLKNGSPEYELAKQGWNHYIQRHCALA